MKAVKFILGADLRGNHALLFKQAKKLGAAYESLADGEAFVFINRAKNRIKTLSWNGVMSYANLEPEKRSVDMSALREFARAFDSKGKFMYDEALKTSLLKRFAEKAGKTAEIY